MVTNVTNLSRAGLYDWVVQRLSAVILLIYALGILSSFVLYPDMGYEQWKAIFSSSFMRIFSLIALLALCGHAWIGMWTISTDYLTNRQIGSSATFFRLAFHAFCVLLILIYLIWGIRIFWSIE